LPALNDVLRRFKVILGDRILDGLVDIPGTVPILLQVQRFALLVASLTQLQYSSGTSIAAFPAGGTLVFANLADQTEQVLEGNADASMYGCPLLTLASL
jgi:hypothetical protein